MAARPAVKMRRWPRHRSARMFRMRCACMAVQVLNIWSWGRASIADHSAAIWHPVPMTSWSNTRVAPASSVTSNRPSGRRLAPTADASTTRHMSASRCRFSSRSQCRPRAMSSRRLLSRWYIDLLMTVKSKSYFRRFASARPLYPPPMMPSDGLDFITV